ncbi:DNA adenine methylase [Helicobacter turcicus]|nr:DNA adenine methylase [Helicobacter turcicus]
MPLFPKDINTAVDLFCGGGSVGINLKAKNIILNDNLSELIRLYENLQTHNIEIIFKKIFHIIKDFKLSHTAEMGYDFYKCNSSKGLAPYNKDKFLQLRNRYNQNKNIFDFFVLVIFAFNNQIRFNSKGVFNLPCGKRDFNTNMQKKIKAFCFKLTNQKYKDFKSRF